METITYTQIHSPFGTAIGRTEITTLSDGVACILKDELGEIEIPYHVTIHDNSNSVGATPYCVTWCVNKLERFDDWESAYQFAVNKLEELVKGEK